MKITRISAREIFDARGWPTVQCEIILEDVIRVYASAPSGLEYKKNSAREMRDGGKRFWGKGVLKSIENIDEMIAPKLIGLCPHGPEMDLQILEIDGTPDKSNLGAQAMLATSMAVYKAQAYAEHVELYELIAYMCGSESVSLPFPIITMLSADYLYNSNVNIQEFMVVPLGAANYRNSYELCILVFHELRTLAQKKGKPFYVGDHGGFVMNFESDEEALSLLLQAIEKISESFGNRCVIALDVGASRLYNPVSKKYTWNNKEINSQELVAYYEKLLDEYPIYSIEDGLSEDDWNGWKLMKALLESRIQLVGGDIFENNAEKIIQGAEAGIAQGVIIKPHHIGTVTETLHTLRLCKMHNLNIIVSHGAGETDETFISDLAVGASAGQIRAGGCSRMERVAKYNRLLEIEDQLMISAIDSQ